MGITQNRVLILCDYYLPGYKAGGPIRTLANIVEHLGDEFEFKLLTRNNDLGEREAYTGVTPDSWSRIGKAEVCHLAQGSLRLPALRRRINAAKPDLLYINSLFSYTFSIKPLLMRRMGLIPRWPVVLAPRGELSTGALALKRVKKRLYLMVAKAMGLHRDITWHASSEYEAANIRRWFGEHVSIKVAPNLPARTINVNGHWERREKTPGQLKIIFISRVDRMKNLRGALKILKEASGEIQFNIYGPLEDQGYWAECRKIIEQLPKNISVRYQGSVEHEQSLAVMREHELFFMPTLGENFGHVIMEALLAGCPVLISDQTPWRGLEEKGVGWDLPLSETSRFRDVIEKCVAMGAEEFARRSAAAHSFALDIVRDENLREQSRRLFEEVDSRQ
ncbi:MAG TPA: glycosyltransferase family 4 protein [Pyrinomonadaceae bacterium]|jgi:glycosyltransferase involved in cell wall biosynthesis